jgi:hypothetical protein
LAGQSTPQQGSDALANLGLRGGAPAQPVTGLAGTGTPPKTHGPPSFPALGCLGPDNRHSQGAIAPPRHDAVASRPRSHRRRNSHRRCPPAPIRNRRLQTHSKEEENHFFLEKIPSSIGPQCRPRTTSPESVDLHLLFRARTVCWHSTSSARPTFKILTQRGCSRHCGRTCMEPVCLRHPHTTNSISLTRTCTHYCHELGGE